MGSKAVEEVLSWELAFFKPFKVQIWLKRITSLKTPLTQLFWSVIQPPLIEAPEYGKNWSDDYRHKNKLDVGSDLKQLTV